nr:hypothetical protein [Spiroplasma clarkii]
MGLNLGRFQSGKFGFMLLALPAAAVAMWLNVPKEIEKLLWEFTSLQHSLVS